MNYLIYVIQNMFLRNKRIKRDNKTNNAKLCKYLTVQNEIDTII